MHHLRLLWEPSYGGGRAVEPRFPVIIYNELRRSTDWLMLSFRVLFYREIDNHLTVGHTFQNRIGVNSAQISPCHPTTPSTLAGNLGLYFSNQTSLLETEKRTLFQRFVRRLALSRVV